ncbi:NAD(P)H-binding protein [Aquimarina sp. U1-2]|uniref:NAD(P)H-binding protein n=1 Tax=Aquimarina sp. U1-2 TaxID=2823141 RepID=UPI001AED11EB|nr:NAD(P)H-binding protein [Aquimarina sp. U1-2]MBP2833159.1 NAD(P)H-binding protein [Aquimarina sp. U1-2]
MQISILGTGWLGLPLAEALMNKNWIIKGSTTTDEKLPTLEKKKIKAYTITLTENGPEGAIASFLKGSELIIINIPPGLRRNPEVDFVAKIEKLIPFIEAATIKKVLFISSTSVFADHESFPVISKETKPNASSNAGKQLIKVEQLLQENSNFKTTILRFSGLFGSKRHPATMLSKRENIKNPKAPVNLIHLEDCIAIIQKIITIEFWGEHFNASYPDHPEKATYYTAICKRMGLSTPDYDHKTPSKGKLISASAIEKELAYTFSKPLDS